MDCYILIVKNQYPAVHERQWPRIFGGRPNEFWAEIKYSRVRRVRPSCLLLADAHTQHMHSHLMNW